jgi:hypothetical protein
VVDVAMGQQNFFDLGAGLSDRGLDLGEVAAGIDDGSRVGCGRDHNRAVLLEGCDGNDVKFKRKHFVFHVLVAHVLDPANLNAANLSFVSPRDLINSIIKDRFIVMSGGRCTLAVSSVKDDEILPQNGHNFLPERHLKHMI